MVQLGDKSFELGFALVEVGLLLHEDGHLGLSPSIPIPQLSLGPVHGVGDEGGSDVFLGDGAGVVWPRTDVLCRPG